MAQVITEQQAAILSDLVYAISTEGDNAGNYIFDDPAVIGDSDEIKTLRNYIYETNAQGEEVFRKGIPDYLKKQITSMPDKFNDALNSFQLRATSTTIDVGGEIGVGGWGYYGIAISSVGDSSNIAVVNKGTSNFGDYVSDMQMAMGKVSANMMAGVNFIKKIQNNLEPVTISTTGHSEGGSIAQAQNVFLGNQLGESITFEAFGIDHILQAKKAGDSYFEYIKVPNEITTEYEYQYIEVTDPNKVELYDKYIENKDIVADKTTNFVRLGDTIADNPLSQQLGEVVYLPESKADLAATHSMTNYLYQAYTEEGELKTKELDLEAVYSSYKSDLGLIAKADVLLAELKAEWDESKLLSEFEFDFLYKEKLQANALNEEVLEGARKRIAEFKAIFNQYENYFVLNEIKAKLMSTYGEAGALHLDVIAERINQLSHAAQSGTRQIIRRDPLVLDLDGDGIETRAADGAVLFDSNADGVRRGTGWVSADDALLVRDINGNGWIDNGRELFGDATLKSDGSIAQEGFEALSDLDSNADGIFDVNDIAFNELNIWQDKNQDGISQKNELMSLTAAKISSIQLNAKTVTINMEGAVVSKIGTYTRVDGTTHEIGNLNFNQNAIYREFTDQVDTSSAAGMLNIEGIGEVRNLQEAASSHDELLTLLTCITSESYANKLALSDDLLYQWAKTANFSDSLRLESIPLDDGTRFQLMLSPEVRSQLDKIQVLENFSANKLIKLSVNGGKLIITHGNKAREYAILSGENNVLMDAHFTKGWTSYRSGWSNVTDINLTEVNSAYESLLMNIKENIFKQTEYTKLIDYLQFNYDVIKGEVSINLDGVNRHLVNYLENDPLSGLHFLQSLHALQSSTLLGKDWDYREVISKAQFNAEQRDAINALKFSFDGKRVIIGMANNDQIKDSAGIDEIYGCAGDDTLVSTVGNDQLYGGDGNDTLTGNGGDTLYGEEGNDILISAVPFNVWQSSNILIGGKGDDLLIINQYGSSTYVYEKGDGADIIRRDNTFFNTFNDILQFGERISFADLNLSKEGNNLRIQIGSDRHNNVLLENFYSTSDPTRTKVGSVKFADGSVVKREDGRLNPDIIGTDGDDELYGTDFPEVIKGGAGNDKLTGAWGNDLLYGGTGDDTLTGNGGDTLYGEEGNDILISAVPFNVWQSSNILIGGKGDDLLIINQYGSSTYVYEKGDGADIIRRDNTFFNTFNDILQFGERISFADLNLSKEGNNLRIQIGSDRHNNVLLENFYSTSDPTRTKVGSVKFADGSVVKREDGRLNPDIIGTDGDDELYGTDFPEVIKGGAGNDKLTGAWGNDLLYGGTGDDTLTGNGGDTLYGEVGNDTLISSGQWQQETLIGGKGDDLLLASDYYHTVTYVYEIGDGADIIRRGATSSSSDFNDILQFGERISFADLNLSKEGNNLRIQVGSNQNNNILIENFYAILDSTRTKVASLEFADGSVIQRYDERLNPDIIGTDGDDELYGTDFSEVIKGGIGNDKITGDGGNDLLYGGDGNDTLTGNGGDTLYGEEGNDILNSADSLRPNTLIGGKGDDLFISHYRAPSTYVYEKGDGADIIRRSGSYSYERFNDILQFGEGISFADLNLSKEGNNLQIQVGSNQNNNILIENFYATLDSTRTKVASLKFADGSVIKREDARLNPDIIGTNGDDELYGTNFSEVIKGGIGNDKITGGGGKDLLYGGMGDDSITGDGDDILYGEAGNDTLRSEGTWHSNILIGGKGNDLLISYDRAISAYIYEMEDGADIIRRSESYSYERFNDILQFGAGIGFEDLSFSKQSNNLRIQVGSDQSNNILIENFYATLDSTRTKVASLKFADGSVIKREDARLNPDIIGTNGDDELYGTNFSEVIKGGIGNDKITGGGGKDLLYGGMGDDSITGDGDDILYGEAGNDTLRSEGTWHSNILIGGKGNDLLISYDRAISTYIYEMEDGADIIRRSGSYSYERFNDILQFGAGIGFEDLSFSKQSNNLRIQVGSDQSNNILIENFYATSEYLRTKVDSLRFADGSVIKREDARLNPDVVGTDSDDVLRGSDFWETIKGGAGNDKLTGAGGYDLLYGGMGDDTITGNGGDILYGEEGNDTLRSEGEWQSNTLIGGKGNDLLISDNYALSTYVYEVGDGADIIRRGGDYRYEIFNDVLQFGVGISLEDLSLSKQGNNLRIQIGSDQRNNVLIEGFYSPFDQTRTKVGLLKFADGSEVKRAFINSGTDGNDILTANTPLSYLHGGNGKDIYQVDFSQVDKVLIDNDDSDNTSDLMQLNGVKTTDLRFYRELSNLVIKNLANQNKQKQVVVQRWFESQNNQIDSINVGSLMLSKQQVGVIIQTLASFNVEDGVGEDLLSQDQQDEISSVLTNAWMPLSA